MASLGYNELLYWRLQKGQIIEYNSDGKPHVMNGHKYGRLITTYAWIYNQNIVIYCSNTV